VKFGNSREYFAIIKTMIAINHKLIFCFSFFKRKQLFCFIRADIFIPYCLQYLQYLFTSAWTTCE
jgi:hypothetical protein